MQVPSAKSPEPGAAPGLASQTASPGEDPTPRKPLRYWQSFALRMCLYFTIYVLSLGPMYWRWWEGKYMHGSKLIAAFYEPLFLLSGWIPPLGWFVNGYVHLWVYDLRVLMV